MNNKQILYKKPLQQWAIENEPGKEMIFHDAYWSQILFVRDDLVRIFSRRFNNQFNDRMIDVIGYHTSKSVTLPVYRIACPDGTELILRNNFHDWKVSVTAPQEVGGKAFDKLFDPDKVIHPIYCEGFEPEDVYGSYNQNKKQFTAGIVYGDSCFFVFCWIVMFG